MERDGRWHLRIGSLRHRSAGKRGSRDRTVSILICRMKRRSYMRCRMFHWSMCPRKRRCRWAGCDRCMRCKRGSRAKALSMNWLQRRGKEAWRYRRHMLGKDQSIQFFDTTWRTARMRGVLQLAADKAGWKSTLPPGHFRGIDCFGCFSSYAGEVVEISMENDVPRVHRVVAVVDCGQVVNPSILEQQIQGGIVFGLADALRAKI